MTPRNAAATAMAVFSAAVIIVFTLTPLPPEYASRAGFLAAGSVRDLLGNTLLFVPLGLAIGLRGAGVLGTIAIASIFSGMIELSQTGIIGRTPAITDIVTNTLGGFMGALLSRSVLRPVFDCGLDLLARIGGAAARPDRRLERWLQAGATVAVLSVFVATGYLLRPGLDYDPRIVPDHDLDTVDGPVRIGGVVGEEEVFAFEGEIDEVRIHDRALPAESIRKLMETPVADLAAGGAEGLVAAYGFDEPAGDRALDSGPHGLTGVIEGARRVDHGKFGGALAFDGKGDAVTIPPARVLDLDGSMTLEAWVRPTGDVSPWPAIIRKEGDAYFLYAGAHQAPNLANGGGTFGGLNTGATARRPIPCNTWTHLAVTYDGAVVRLFVDGELDTQETLSFGGRLESASLAEVPIEPGRITDPAWVRATLAGAPILDVVAVGGPPVENSAPIFSILGPGNRPEVALRVQSDDLLLQQRRKGSAFGLWSPPSRAIGPLAGRDPGSRIEIMTSLDPVQAGFLVNGTLSRTYGPTLGSGWALGIYSDPMPPRLLGALDVVWIAVLFLPLGYWSRGSWGAALAVILAAVFLAGLPYLIEVRPTPLPHVAVAAAAACLGRVFRGFNRADQPSSAR